MGEGKVLLSRLRRTRLSALSRQGTSAGRKDEIKGGGFHWKRRGNYAKIDVSEGAQILRTGRLRTMRLFLS
jgi:hypothetical protein